MGRRSPPASASASASGSASTKRQSNVDSSFLANLHTLREFVGDSFTESDLSSSLRQCGYCVERAAELLYSGQFKNPSFASYTASVTPSPHNKRVKKDVKEKLNTTATAKTATKPAKQPKLDSKSGGLLLCKRWIVGLSTRRNGRISYQEKAVLSTSKIGPPIVRFKGTMVEGTLPLSLSSFLAPLLRQSPSEPLISLIAVAIMEDRGIQIGGEVPLSLSVYIERPQCFFDLFTENNAGLSKTAKNYLASATKNKKMRYPIADAAFALLQWAQYGDAPSFTAASDNKTDNSDSEEDELLEEGQFLVDQGTSMDTKEDLSLASAFHPGKDDSIVMPETSDPEGLRGGVSLRSYQRQALHWMLKRENCSEDESILKREMDLLAEVHGGAKPSTAVNKVSIENMNAGIVCDCGPVLVSEQAASQAITTDGRRYPVHHPLWAIRHLAQASPEAPPICFFVNELLGIASSRPPNAPRQCVGGILADEMGLGKTVMLLSLILSDKDASYTEQKKSVTSPEKDENCSHSSQKSATMPGTNQCIMDSDNINLSKSRGANTSPRSTLVIAPLSLIAQWEEEAATKTDLSHKIYYGDAVKGAPAFDKFDLVITTYGTIQGEYASALKYKSSQSHSEGLLTHQWRRVVLDEAHCIKNPATIVSKACCSLKAERRWCVSGTPIQNSLQDAYGLLKFLKHEPWCDAVCWKIATAEAQSEKPTVATEGTQTLQHTGAESAEYPQGIKSAVERVRRVLAPLLLRRTKETVGSDGNPILMLPPVETVVVEVAFSDAERCFYNALLQKSQSVFEGFIKAGTASKSWFAIFSLLQRLRQTCDHVSLTAKARMDDFRLRSPKLKKNTAEEPLEDSFVEGLLHKFQNGSEIVPTSKLAVDASSFSATVASSLNQSIQANATTLEDECPICLEKPVILEAAWTPCAHVFCRQCLLDYLRQTEKETQESQVKAKRKTSQECPSCNASIDSSQIITVSKHREKYTSSFLISTELSKSTYISSSGDCAARSTLERALSGANSAKLSSVLKELHEVWKIDPCCKILVFSQFLGFLDLMESKLKSSDIPHSRFDGSMNLKDRISTLEKFNQMKAPGALNGNKKIGIDESARVGAVMLISMKAGGVGINLVSASAVFIVDPWWNDAVERQCINRIHRIGQKAAVVRVRKFVVTDSVEEKIVALQKRKSDMASDVINNRSNDFAPSDSRPSLDDFKVLFR